MWAGRLWLAAPSRADPAGCQPRSAFSPVGAHPSIETGQHRHCCKEIDPRAFPGATMATRTGHRVSRRLGTHRPRASASSDQSSCFISSSFQRNKGYLCSHGIFQSPSRINTHPQTVWETARLAPQRCLPWFLFSEQRLLTNGMSASYCKCNKREKKINLN